MTNQISRECGNLSLPNELNSWLKENAAAAEPLAAEAHRIVQRKQPRDEIQIDHTDLGNILGRTATKNDLAMAGAIVSQYAKQIAIAYDNLAALADLANRVEGIGYAAQASPADAIRQFVLDAGADIVEKSEERYNRWTVHTKTFPPDSTRTDDEKWTDTYAGVKYGDGSFRGTLDYDLPGDHFFTGIAQLSRDRYEDAFAPLVEFRKSLEAKLEVHDSKIQNVVARSGATPFDMVGTENQGLLVRFTSGESLVIVVSKDSFE